MSFFLRSISILILGLFPLFTFSQSVDDSLSLEVSVSESNLTFQHLNYDQLDGFQQYRPFGAQRLPMARSGNIGLPVHFFHLTNQGYDINQLLGAYQPYLITKDSIRYYKMSRPFTELRYMNGAEAEQYFSAFHSQNLGEGLNISFEYNRITSEGFFLQQLTNHTQFRSSYLYHSRNNRFQSRAYFLINSLEAQENGGVFASENDDPDDNTALLDIGLRDAQNRLRTQGVGATNSFNILMKDSVTSLLKIRHTVDWSKARGNYSDNITVNRNFYQNYFLDTLQTADTANVEELSNQFELEILNGLFSLGFKSNSYHYFQNTFINRDLHSNSVTANYQDSISNFGIIAFAEKGVSGFYSENTKLNVTVGSQPIKRLHAQLRFFSEDYQPDFFTGNERANHFSFQKELKVISERGLQLKVSDEVTKIGLSVKLATHGNFLYFDSLAIPQQAEEDISELEIRLDKKINFFKNWFLMNRIVFQQFSNEVIIPLPELYSYHSLYYQNRFFKDALKVQVGVDFYYISEYNGYAYSPALSQLHLRNGNQNLGAINQLDLFLNLQIKKSSRIFVKMENVLSNSYDENSERIQNYPIAGRALKVGFSWRMLN